MSVNDPIHLCILLSEKELGFTAERHFFHRVNLICAPKMAMKL